MTAAAKEYDMPVSVRPTRRFWVGLIAAAIALLTAGAVGFWSILAGSPLALLEGSDRSIATATVFIPAPSPFTISLLTQPDRLVALQQAMTAPDLRRSALAEVDDIKAYLLKQTGLDYDRDLQPWVGHEVTFAFTDRDLGASAADGVDEVNSLESLTPAADGAPQPGYLFVLEIEPGKAQQAREFLQFFWQQQSLSGNVPQAERINGARSLYSPKRLKRPSSNQSADQPNALPAATALVGDRFVLFANDVRVLRRSLHATQNGANLAQNRAYRDAVAQLPQQRIGLAYVKTSLLTHTLNRATGVELTAEGLPKFIAASLAITHTGLAANAWVPAETTTNKQANDRANANELTDLAAPNDMTTQSDLAVLALAVRQFLPADTTVALTGQNFAQIKASLKSGGLSNQALPSLFQLGFETLTDQRPFSLAYRALSDDWIWAIAHDPEGMDRLDRRVQAQGYSAVPVPIGEVQAIAWTKFTARPLQRDLGRKAASDSLETEILGLHVQQGDYDLFANTLSAMESALSAAADQNLPLAERRFQGAIAALKNSDNGYLYIDWPAISAPVIRAIPALKAIETAARPLVSRIDTLAVTRHQADVSFSIQTTAPAATAAPSR